MFTDVEKEEFFECIKSKNENSHGLKGKENLMLIAKEPSTQETLLTYL